LSYKTETDLVSCDLDKKHVKDANVIKKGRKILQRGLSEIAEV
jgi:hypothetical protein